MEIYVIAAITGIIPGMIAQSKGRSFFVWWFYGAAFFIIALPHSILIKTRANEEQPLEWIFEQSQQEPTYKKCPFCAETIRKVAILCRYCRSDLSEFMDEQPEPKPALPELSEKEIRDKIIETYNTSDLLKCKEYFDLLVENYPNSPYMDFIGRDKLEEINEKIRAKGAVTYADFLKSLGYTLIHENDEKWVIKHPNKTGSTFVYSHKELKENIRKIAEQNDAAIPVGIQWD